MSAGPAAFAQPQDRLPAQQLFASNHRFVLPVPDDAYSILVISSSFHRDRVVLRPAMRIGVAVALADQAGEMWYDVKTRIRPISLALLAISVSSPKTKKRTRSLPTVRFSNEVELQAEDTREVSVAPLLRDENSGSSEDEGDGGEEEDLGDVYLTSGLQVLELSPGSTLFLGQGNACVTRIGKAVHLLTPRISPSQAATVKLDFSAHVADFALKDGDWVETRGSGFRLFIPKLARSFLNSSGATFNPAQRIPNLALKLRRQHTRRTRWNGTVEYAPTSPPRTFSQFPPGQEIKLGRECAVGEPHDHTLAAHHATIFAHLGTEFYSIAPAKDGKPVHLLLGGAGVHSRPAVALRLGDYFTTGKTEFCVVFHQRGNRLALSQDKPSVLDEFTARLGPFRSNLNPRSRSSSPEVSSLTTTTSVCGEEDHRAHVPKFTSLPALVEYFQLAPLKNEPALVLMSVRGPRSKQFFMCNATETTFGSAKENPVSISNDGRMSPAHCRVYFCPTQERWMLEDLDSRNGTFLRVTYNRPLLLCQGDVLTMGLTSIEIA